MSAGTCANCGLAKPFLNPLHGEGGGAEVCFDCSAQLLGDIRKRNKRENITLSNIFGGGFFGGGVGGAEIYSELLKDTLALTHPDLHPDQAEKATRVTAELTALREESRPKPNQEKSDGNSAVEHANGDHAVTAREPEPETYPCSICRHLHLISFYCDRCRARWESDREAERERERVYRRELRARRRDWWLSVCEVCEEQFKPSRRDSRYCSNACRQRAHRNRQRSDVGA